MITWWASHICFSVLWSSVIITAITMLLPDAHGEMWKVWNRDRKRGGSDNWKRLPCSMLQMWSLQVKPSFSKHLWKSICRFTISPPILVSPQTQSNLNPGAVYATWHSQQMIRTGFIVHRWTNHHHHLHHHHHHHLHLHPPDHDQHSGLHEEVCGSLQCLQICNCPKRGTNEGVMMIMIVIMVIENMLAWKDKLPYNSIVMMTLFNDQYGNDDIAFFSPRPPGSMLWTRISIRIASSVRWPLPSSVINEIINQKMITIRPRYLPSQIVSKRWNFIHSFFQWWKNVIVKMILKLRKIEEKTTRTARWFSTPGWRGKSVGRSGSTCSASNATDGGKTRVFLYFNFIVKKFQARREWTGGEWRGGVNTSLWRCEAASLRWYHCFPQLPFQQIGPKSWFWNPEIQKWFFYQKKLAKMDKKVWTIWKQWQSSWIAASPLQMPPFGFRTNLSFHIAAAAHCEPLTDCAAHR